MEKRYTKFQFDSCKSIWIMAWKRVSSNRWTTVGQTTDGKMTYRHMDKRTAGQLDSAITWYSWWIYKNSLKLKFSKTKVAQAVQLTCPKWPIKGIKADNQMHYPASQVPLLGVEDKQRAETIFCFCPQRQRNLFRVFLTVVIYSHPQAIQIGQFLAQ